MICLDTHVVLWLYAGELDLFPAKTQALLEKNDLIISPMVLLELQYLYEIKRTKISSRVIFDELKSKIGLAVAGESFQDITLLALDQSWTRDPFDRLIVAHAKLLNLKLVTKDTSLQKHYSNAVWA